MEYQAYNDFTAV